MGLLIKLKDNGEPESIHIDGVAIAAKTLDLRFRVAEPVMAVLEVYVQDQDGWLVRSNGLEPDTERKEFYACSYDEFKLLEQLRAEKKS